ncbi:hypothetical protein NKJ90_29380 [Mesorhizobium sp. M0051]|uniref:hypothetical protein n=1 Tax=unclassified Mesorhizobium TaxID=325217 RepID=UPI0018DD8158|nr:hypothetical protein [Mesorhizobium sp. LNHC252B00]
MYDPYSDHANIDSPRSQINFLTHNVWRWGAARSGVLMSSLNKRHSCFHPSDLQLCQRVFDQVCFERKLDRMSLEPDVQELAATVFVLFENGCRIETELLDSFRRTRQ